MTKRASGEGQGGADAAAAATGAARAGGRSGRGSAAASGNAPGAAYEKDSRKRLDRLVAAVSQTGQLRDDYQALAGRFPLLYEVGGAIFAQKAQADHAAVEAYKKTHALLSSFCEQTGQLSDAMLAQHEAIKDILDNPQDLTDLLSSGRSDFISVLAQHGPAGVTGGTAAGAATMDNALSFLKAAEGQAQVRTGQVIDDMQRAVNEKTREVQQFVEALQNGQKTGKTP